MLSKWSSFLSVAVVKYLCQKQHEEERVYLTFTTLSLSISEGSQGGNSNRNLEVGTMEVLLAPFWLSQLSFLHGP